MNVRPETPISALDTKFFAGKRILVTGGTGSFGHHIVRRLLDFEPGQVVVFSRDEKKQWDMQQEFGANPLLSFVLGDVRDFDTVAAAMRGAHIVYHAAALKQVPNCELFPLEATKTNVLGTDNVRRAALAARVEVVVAISTDKAVKPVNVMGMTKAVAERLILPTNDVQTDTRFLCVRYGNVIGSRGSVIPLFTDCIAAGRKLPITDPQMTRFLLTLEEAIESVFLATTSGEHGTLHVRKMPACTVGELAKVIGEAITGRRDYPEELIGIRPGEKMHEVLVSEEEMHRVVETSDGFTIYQPNHRLASRKESAAEYSSDTAQRLNAEQILSIVKRSGWLDGAVGVSADRRKKAHSIA